MSKEKKHIVCIASEHKGNEFLEECNNANWQVTLVTRKDLLDYPWAWTAIGDVKTVERYATQEEYVRAIVNVAGDKKIDRVIGLDEFDVLTAAKAREHLQMEGISNSFGLRFRDKLRMRNLAVKNGIPCPDFVGAFNQDEINRYLQTTSAPWIVKPRTEVSAFGIRKCDTPEQVWQALTDLDNRHTWRDHPSQFLIERFIRGRVFHVDSVVNNGKIIVSGVNEYGETPLAVTHQGGVFTSFTLDYKSKERKELEKLNKKLLEGFEFKNGVTHAEFLQSADTGEFFLLEVACRVGGAYIANVHEYANGFNLWREWAKIEIADKENPYKPPKLRKDFAAVALCLAKEETPDTSHYTDAEIVYRVSKPRHVGLIFHSNKHDRIRELLQNYTEKMTNDYLDIVPTKERYDD